MIKKRFYDPYGVEHTVNLISINIQSLRDIAYTFNK